MRDDFEITVPGIDRLVEIMQKAIGNNGGARMTGGGFGGAAVGLLKSEHVPAVRAPAVFLVDSRESRPPSPVTSRIATPGDAASRATTTSPGSSSAKPSTSNPAATLETVAGADAAITAGSRRRAG